MRVAAAAFAIVLSSCAAPPPPRDPGFFEAAWQADPVNAARQPLDEYLRQVRAFYAGSLLAPGWTRAQQRLLLEHPELEDMLEALGRAAAAEWAKDNSVRRLDSVRLYAWSRDIEAGRREGRLAEVVDRLLLEAGNSMARGSE